MGLEGIDYERPRSVPSMSKADFSVNSCGTKARGINRHGQPQPSLGNLYLRLI